MTDFSTVRKSRARNLLLATSAVALFNYIRFMLGLTFPHSIVDNVVWIGDVTARNRWFADFLVPLFVLYWISVFALVISIAQQMFVRIRTGRPLEGYYGCLFAIVGYTVIAGFAGPYNLGFIFIQNAKITALPVSLVLFMISSVIFMHSFCAIQMLLDPEMLIANMKAGKG